MRDGTLDRAIIAYMLCLVLANVTTVGWMWYGIAGLWAIIWMLRCHTVYRSQR